MYLLKFSILILTYLVILSCKSEFKGDFIQIDSLTTQDSLHHSKQVYIIAFNYRKSKINDLMIDTFIFKNSIRFIADIYKYNTYYFWVYKDSERTRYELNNLTPSNFGKYSQTDDMLYKYMFYEGKFIGKFEYQKGILTNGDDIIISRPHY